MKKKENTAPATEVEGVVEPIKKTPTAQRIIGIVINVVLIIAIVLAVMATYVSFSTSKGQVPAIFGLRMYSVQTNSMEPTLNEGDLVFSTAVKNPKDLKVNDIITFYMNKDGERVLNTHRIVDVQQVSGGLAFMTQGDNNSIPDQQLVYQHNVVGKVGCLSGSDTPVEDRTYTRIGALGKVFDYLQTPTGFLLVVVIPVLLFLLYQLIHFFRVLFEYQNVKNRIKFEMERGRTEDLLAENEANQLAERERMEAELREKLRAELLAEQKAATEQPAAEQPATEQPAAEQPATEQPAAAEGSDT